VRSDIAKYISGERNAIKDEFIVSREKCGGSEYVQVHHMELPEPIYAFWSSRKKDKKPKHTGGKKPYAMLMMEELIRLMKGGLPAESTGYLIYLVPYIEWGTGRLIHGRNKKQMKFADIMKVFGKSYKTTQAIIATLKDHDLLAYTKEGYFISRELIKRGVAK
jgi:hypothetical protein